jgi:hypothetical protein
MSPILAPQRREFYRALDDILWRDWDPIGIFAIEAAWNAILSDLPPSLSFGAGQPNRNFAAGGSLTLG